MDPFPGKVRLGRSGAILHPNTYLSRVCPVPQKTVSRESERWLRPPSYGRNAIAHKHGAKITFEILASLGRQLPRYIDS